MSDGPLAGTRVLDLTRLLPGGYATLLLADLGADVVKVEEPRRGDYVRWAPPLVGEHSAAHIALNRNKRSITLNLKSERGRETLLDLVPLYDVVIESFRPGVLSRLGAGYEEMRERRTDLVYCAITGYGQDGPRAAEAGHDANYIGYGGVLSIGGRRGGAPVLPGVQIGDLAGGAMSAVIAVLAALNRRNLTGQGDLCDVSILDGVVSWLSIHAAAHVATRTLPGPETTLLTGAYPCYRIYPAADGWLTVGAIEPKFWTNLCRALGRADLIDDGYATGERGEDVVAALEGIFRTRTRRAWMDELHGLDVCVAPVNDVAEALADDQVRARRMAVDEELQGVGPWTHLGNPLRFASTGAGLVRLPPPRLGEHTDAVLLEAGLDEGQIAELRSLGAI